MQNCRHNHDVLSLKDLVDNAIRKAFRVAPANILSRVAAGVQQGIFFQRVPNPDDLLHEFGSQPRLPRLLPNGGFGYVVLDLRAKLDGPAHLTNRERRRVSISLSGTADLGARR